MTRTMPLSFIFLALLCEFAAASEKPIPAPGEKE